MSVLVILYLGFDSPAPVSIVGSVVECSPATRAARVRFPDDANFYDFSLANKYVGPQMIHSSDISTPLPISVRQHPSDWLFKVQTE